VSKDLLLINAAAFLRSFTFGLTGVVLGIYLFRVGLSSFNMVISAGLAGSALGTVGVTTRADRVGRRRTLIALSLLGAIGTFPSTHAFFISGCAVEFIGQSTD
jgi:MFS family permease